MAQSLKPSLWPLVTGIYPIPSAGSVYDDLVLFLHAFTPLITFGLICNSFRFACFVNSSLRFLIPNLHPICTCSCLFTPLTEGRSARDLTQAATSQKKKDNSDRPSYLLWPIRGGNGQFLLVDPWSCNYFDLEAAEFMEPIGIERFFDAFSLEQKRPLKVDAASALNIPVKEVSDLLVVSQDRAKRFELTPVWAPVEPPTKRVKTAEVRLSSASNVPMPPTKDDNEKGSSDEEDSDSSGSNSDVSSQDDSSDVSDLEKFDEAYTDFSALTKGVDPQTLERDGSGNPNDEVSGIDLPGGMKALHSLANVPKSWPLEIFVRNTNPDLQLHYVRKFAKDLVSCLLSIWLRQFLRCFGMYWTILARSSMILRLNPCSYLSSGSTPSTGKCLTQLLGMDLASLWS